jgi:hypothetical protein
MDELNNWGCRHLPFNVAAAPAFRYNFATKSTAQNLQRGFYFNLPLPAGRSGSLSATVLQTSKNTRMHKHLLAQQSIHQTKKK